MAQKKNTNALPPDHPLQDFRNFLFLVWTFLWEAGAITAPKPDPTAVQYDIAYYLQHGPRRKVIEAFRGVGKSWITAAYVCWRLLLNPHLNFLVVSASKDRSDQFSIFTKRLIYELPILAHLKPKDNQRTSNIAFDVGPAGVSHSPSVKSVGITGQMTGSRADEIIADDVESLNNSLTQLMRDVLGERIKEFDAILKPGGNITYLGTPQTEMSIYNVLEDRGYQIRVWPARIPKDPSKYGNRLAPYIMGLIEHGAKEGQPTDPQRFSHEDLLEREASYGKSGFALQFMLDTTLSDADKYPLKLKDLIVMPLDTRMAPVKVVWSSGREYVTQGVPVVGLAGDRFYGPMWVDTSLAEYTGAMMFIDPSGRGTDETSYAVVKMLHGWLYLVDVGGFTGGYEDATLEKLAKIARLHQVNIVQAEPNFGDGMFLELFRPHLQRHHACRLEEGPRVSQQKERRIIDILEPVLTQHRLVVDEALIKKDFDSAPEAKYGLFYQMTRLTRDRGSLAHDDRLDALSGAVAYWVDQLGRDTEKAAQSHREELLQQELDKFMDQALGYTRKKDKWVNVQ
ncbi:MULTISPECIES: phage terminase large subunit [unclassified Thioalkalivibrio]|uniref:phage terminase large subunit n=1 Tax=unclassified Thioalkalivibrio TaxID=2621013 RepID=UPI00036C4D06|nr:MULTISPECIES: phage terminase large subunit [unclassified Thioalkalivibrio]